MRRRPRMPTIGGALAALAALAACGTDPAASAPVVSPVVAPDPTTATVVGYAPRTSSGFPAIVILEPARPTDAAVPAEPALLDQLGRQFVPGLLFVRPGQQVEVRNSEDELHTVRVFESRRGETVLNIAMPIRGSYIFAFERTGIYSVRCDVHSAMAADIFVTSTPHAAAADKEGYFSFSNVPVGSYRLTVRRDGRTTTWAVEVTAPRTELVIDGES